MLTPTLLKAALDYDPSTGIFRWKTDRRAPIRAGDIAGTYNAKGYRQITLGRTYGAHRLAWLYMTGAWPVEQIDHKNGIRDDNRWCNLREATNAENCAARGIKTNNRLGLKGVYRAGSKFAVCLYKGSERFYLGRFDTQEAASTAYAKAANDIHGDFANTTTGTTSGANDNPSTNKEAA